MVFNIIPNKIEDLAFIAQGKEVNDAKNFSPNDLDQTKRL
jgi:hypothetical protein